jgi:hypothetical protein
MAVKATKKRAKKSPRPKKSTKKKAAKKRAKKAGGRKKTTRKKKPQKRANPIGRPRIEFDLTVVAQLGKIRAPYEIMASALDCHVDTVRERMRVDGPQYDEAFSKAYLKGRAERNIGLRTKQYNVAMAGEVRMLIHLGKCELGQVDELAVVTDPQAIAQAKAQSTPDPDDYSLMSTKDLKALRDLLAKADKLRQNADGSGG